MISFPFRLGQRADLKRPLMRFPLRLGRIAPDSYSVQRSGFRWLCSDGEHCPAGRPLRFVISEFRNRWTPEMPSASEYRDFQAALVLQIGGRIRISADISRGGFLDRHTHDAWDPNLSIGEVECESGQVPDDAMPVRIVIGAGRRFTEYAEIRTGLFTGWHNRSRVWSAGGGDIAGTLLSLGSCEFSSAVHGERFDFSELHDAAPGPAQVILVPDDVLVPAARIVLEQIQRTPEQWQEIAADLASTFAAKSGMASASDWFFAGGLLSVSGAPR